MSEFFTMRIPVLGKWDVFAPGALDGQVGETVTLHRQVGDVEGTIAAAKVVENGAAVDLTIEVPDGAGIEVCDGTAHEGGCWRRGDA